MSCKNPTSLFLFRFICLQELEASDSAPGVLAAPKIIRVDPESRRSGASPGRPTREQGAKKYGAAPVYRLTVCEPETGFWGSCPDTRVFRRVADVLPGGRGRVETSGDGRVGPGDVGGLEWCVHLRLYLRHVAARGRHARPRRLFFACASDSDRTVFVAGGHDGEKCALKSAMAYDVARDEWSHLPDMSAERDESKGSTTAGNSTSSAGRFPGRRRVSAKLRGRRGREVVHGARGRRGGPGGIVRVASRGGAAVGREKHGVRDGVAGETAGDWIERFGAPYKTYLLDLKRCKWEKVEADEEFSGHVQSGCCLEL
ncbi:hypothetical protein DH2020_041365 [Rehmannia glutinosa]|uniref:F-box/kelch-repeat protein n=1 Tax=Rehmannia glutinosa TaxID=99300 RepID=A0ABR0URK8_REHGL